MPPPNPANDEAHQQLLIQLDISQIHKPFRNPHWKPSQRRNKNLKQIISENARKEASVLATQANSGATTPFPATSGGVTTEQSQTPTESAGGAPNLEKASQNLSTLVLEKNARTMFPSGPAVTYTNIESAPSLNPAQQQHYCDITGLPGPYTDPKTRLRYHDKEIFKVIRSLAQGVPEHYLEARGAQVILK
ncbi:YL1 nuclear C-terminal [Penicillium alfredii]|uniref:YL1 nuclear C-terminal n=1 Tax=Penicillium alfredii TaxID=1506179 RepID=A0A9W9FJD8_9EURO|nr:YL1 nuclear C-terminal [Penicillium alfredii]KAJ5101289.1 YL1 nuclear C-terminal [Penicillium alfredii]